MKERRWIAAFAAEGVLCAGLTLLLNGSAAADAGLMAFPFAQIGAGLRALSLMGGVRNVLAIMLMRQSHCFRRASLRQPVANGSRFARTDSCFL